MLTTLCCGVLKRLIYHPRPSEVVFSPFAAEFDPDKCIACGICIDRCSMDAFTDTGRIRIPDTIDDTWKEIAQARKKASLLL